MSRARASVTIPRTVEGTLDAFVTGVRARFGNRVVDRDDDRAITDLSADLTWQLAGVVISPMVMSVDEFDRWKARERATPLAIERERIAL